MEQIFSSCLLYEDDDILVVEKPIGLLTLPSETEARSLLSLWTEKRAKIGNYDPLYPVHRLDRPTGGVVLFAKHPKAAAQCSTVFATHEVQKTYLAVVEGVPERQTGIYEDILYADRRKDKAFLVTRERKGAKKASLSYWTLASQNGFSLVKVCLHTGRMHQIRAQFAGHGTPLAGDGKYGGRAHGCKASLWAVCLDAACLHSHYHFVSAPPTDLYPFSLFVAAADAEIKRLRGL